jgi:hypothetical protein
MSSESLRKRLAEATPGPWEWVSCETRGAAFLQDQRLTGAGWIPVRDKWGTIINPEPVVLCAEADGYEVDSVGIDVRHADADLIAHAPTDLALALEVIEALRAAGAARDPSGWGGYSPNECGWCEASLNYADPGEEAEHEEGCEYVALMAALDAFEASP